MTEKSTFDPARRFFNLDSVEPVSDVIARAKAKGEASKEDAADRRGKFVAITGAMALGTGVVAAADYAFEHDPVTQKFKSQEQVKVVDASEVPQALPENPQDLVIEIPEAPQR